MKQKLISLVLIGLVLTFAQAPVSSQANQVAASSSQPQGFGPFAIEITQDGQYAYLSFDLYEVIFKVRLTDLTVIATADLSAYFPIECEYIALDATETKLFVHSPTWRKLLVLDTETMSLIHTIDNYDLTGMVRSQFGSHLITWDGGGTVRFVNTDTYEETQHTNNSIGFLKIQESRDDQTKWYVLTGSGGTAIVGLYDHVAKSWSNSVTFPLQQSTGEGFFDFRVLPNGQKAYVATFGGWYTGYQGYGWLYAVDLVTKQVKVLAIDGGALCLEANSAGTRLYVGTGWPLPNTNNLLVVDTASDSVAGSIPLGRTIYGWNYTQMNDLQIDPAHPGSLYATSSDGNAFIKVDIDRLSLADVHVLNNETFKPNFFVRRPTQAFGNILVESSLSFELNLDNATIQNLVTFPSIRQDAGAYDIGVLNTGRLLIAQGEQFLEVDPQNMQLIATHPLPSGVPSIWQFVLSNDKTKIYTVTYSSDGTPNIFIALDTTTFQVEKQLTLAGGSFEFRPFVLPDDSKMYAVGGLANGPVVVHVIRTTDYTIEKTITYDQSDRLGISAGPNYPYAYDPVSRTLFVGATYVVLAIDTSTDVIKNVIYLGDAATAIGLQPSQLTYINAVGLVYNPTENYLYIAHLDRSFVSIYDLTNGSFLPKLISLKGYFPYMLFANDAYDKIYSINKRSDSISVIDVPTKTVEKVIDLFSLTNAPQNVVASDGTYVDKVALTWSAVSGATGYQAWRNTSNDSSSATQIGTTSQTNYNDTDAVVGLLYYYWVKVTNNSGTSAFSSSDSGWRSDVCAGICADYDGDGLADPAIYDETTGTWRIKLSGSGYYLLVTTFNGLGGPGYASVAADYDGDRKADPAVYNEANGIWIILPSSLGYAVPIVLGQTLGGIGYSGMPADYDGDAKADPGVYKRDTGDWKVMLSSANYATVELPGLLGGTSYRAVAADYDGDRLADPAIYGESNGYWIFKLSSIGYVEIALTQTLGGTDYIPVPVDYDGDGKADPAVRSQTSNEWIVMFSSGNYTPVHLTILFE